MWRSTVQLRCLAGGPAAACVARHTVRQLDGRKRHLMCRRAGAGEFAAGRLTSGIVGPACVEAVLAAGFVWAWCSGR